jgi:uncharacterized protein (DUF697 family)
MNKEKESGTHDSKSKHADTIIRNHVIWSMGAGFIPVIIADVLAISALQLDMIRQMCRVYDVDFSETQGKAIVSSLTSSSLARIAARGVVKLIPGVGSVLGGVTLSMFAGASTYALGEVFKKHFETGGTILDFDPDRLKNIYKEKFEKGKKVAEEWRKQQQQKEEEPEAAAPAAPETSSKEAILHRLKELSELKNQGAITEEEYEQMKKKLIDQF